MEESAVGLRRSFQDDVVEDLASRNHSLRDLQALGPVRIEVYDVKRKQARDFQRKLIGLCRARNRGLEILERSRQIPGGPPNQALSVEKPRPDCQLVLGGQTVH